MVVFGLRQGNPRLAVPNRLVLGIASHEMITHCLPGIPLSQAKPHHRLYYSLIMEGGPQHHKISA